MQNTLSKLLLVCATTLWMAGCASLQSVDQLSTEFTLVQQEWQAFAQAYDPNTRRELNTNLLELQRIEHELRALRDEATQKTHRINALLAQIENNELDQAIATCQRVASQAHDSAGLAQHYANISHNYARDAAEAAGTEIEQHLWQYHHNNQAQTKRIHRLEKQVSALIQQNRPHTPLDGDNSRARH